MDPIGDGVQPLPKLELSEGLRRSRRSGFGLEELIHKGLP
jgi:hypothetical protein